VLPWSCRAPFVGRLGWCLPQQLAAGSYQGEKGEVMTTAATVGRDLPHWRLLAQNRVSAGNLIHAGLVLLLVAVAVAIAGELDPSTGEAWSLVGGSLIGSTCVASGVRLRKRAIIALRQLPSPERRLALEYIQGEYQLRQELNL
jgi:hypothetical protein